MVSNYEQSFQKFKSIISYTNLIQLLYQDTGAYYEIKGLVNTLINLSESVHKTDLSWFLDGFGPLLESVAQHIQQQKELHEKDDEKNCLRLQEVNQSTFITEETFSLEAAAQREEAELEDLEMNIPLREMRLGSGKQRREISGCES